MKLRLIGAGFESYTGQMGVINFENGVSVSEVSPLDAVRVAGIIGAEWEDGTPANVAQSYIDNMNTPAPVFVSEPVNEAVSKASVEAPVAATGTVYTEAELAKIADSEGIAGLRAIAEPLNIKSNSIRGLIDAIVKSGGVPASVQDEEVQ